jgi:prepilin-type N-terminal cleavage/methylation domain-containing protein
MEKTNVKKSGFTIVELLTVMAVIAVLIGLLVPALGLVKDNAKRIQQKAQFHSIDVGVELYKSEFGSYPESNDNIIGTYSSPVEDQYDVLPYCGANKLAEAMVGMDYLGFHPSSAFNASGSATVTLNTPIPGPGDVQVYSANADVADWQTADENIKARKGPFMDLENANAFAMDEVYSTNNTQFPGSFDMTGTSYPALVLCDVYAKKRSGTGAKKAGTPILYFRARTNYSHQDSDASIASAPNPGDNEDDIYYLNDNVSLLNLGMPDDGVDYTLMTGGTIDEYDNFDNMIVNEQVQTLRRPYRADSFILISAGKDGDFGTADDVFNFDKEIIE